MLRSIKLLFQNLDLFYEENVLYQDVVGIDSKRRD